ncbi:anthranilate phosphoribosyltransferase [Candidatus Sumerlaeota bacterium]|nr:anthranilate phosphoribosyltransferase [Candidatus Sumerlaeota bacterium]
MIEAIIDELVVGSGEGTLCPDPARLRAAMDEIMRGEALPTQIAAMLMGMRVRGEKPEHLKAVVDGMLAYAAPFPRAGIDGVVVDTCGPGGLGRGLMNVSTGTALLAAAAGVRTAKHGNKSVSSKSGSADVLQALGYKIDCSPAVSSRLLRDHNFCFLFAPLYHPAMRHAGPVRREIKVRTVFNLAGPLSNPALPNRQLIGVSHTSMMPLMAGALRLLGRERALIVHGQAGHDEISLSQITNAIFLTADGNFLKMIIDPADFGVEKSTLNSLAIDSPADSAERLRRVLEGEQSAVADEINVNVGAVLWLADRVGGLQDGFEIAREVQRSGKGAQLLDTLVAESQKEA